MWGALSDEKTGLSFACLVSKSKLRVSLGIKHPSGAYDQIFITDC
jgi:hypothetical protein